MAPCPMTNNLGGMFFVCEVLKFCSHDSLFSSLKPRTLLSITLDLRLSRHLPSHMGFTGLHRAQAYMLFLHYLVVARSDPRGLNATINCPFSPNKLTNIIEECRGRIWHASQSE